MYSMIKYRIREACHNATAIKEITSTILICIDTYGDSLKEIKILFHWYGVEISQYYLSAGALADGVNL